MTRPGGKEHDPEAIDDLDNPEWTEADFARAVPFAQMFPEQTASLKKQGGRPRLAQPKVPLSDAIAKGLL